MADHRRTYAQIFLRAALVTSTIAPQKASRRLEDRLRINDDLRLNT
jgi:hypothetical protein